MTKTSEYHARSAAPRLWAFTGRKNNVFQKQQNTMTTYLNQHEVNLLQLLRTGCSAYSTNFQDAAALRSLQRKRLILIWNTANWGEKEEKEFDVTYQTYGCYPNYVEDGELYRILD